MTAREWDATTYDQVGAPMTRRGTALLDRLTLRGDEHVLDAGCGTGRVTRALLDRLPDGQVTALDGSGAMVEEARRVLGDDPRVDFAVGDLTQPLGGGPFDAIVSTSTFHWVPGHAALWSRLHAALRPGGVLLADFGGAGNIASVLAALRDAGYDEHPWTFDPPETAERDLRAAGFTDVRVDHVGDPVDLDAEQLETYLRTVVLGWHVERYGDAVVGDVARRLERPHLDYVRLQVLATVEHGARRWPAPRRRDVMPPQGEGAGR